MEIAARGLETTSADVLGEFGVKITTDHLVTSARELEDADVVMLDVAPSAAVDLLGDAMSATYQNRLRRFQHGPGVFKVELAVEGGVPWSHEASRRAGTVHVGGTYEEIAAAELLVHQGAMPERPFVLVGQQYLADAGRSNGTCHPLYTYAHVPAGFSGDATEAIELRIERFAPGFRSRIVAKHVQSTAQLSQGNPNIVDGDVLTGANSPRQLVFRPRIGLDPYWLGTPGYYLCSAGTPPGAGAHGMCGFNAARSALRELRVARNILAKRTIQVH